MCRARATATFIGSNTRPDASTAALSVAQSAEAVLYAQPQKTFDARLREMSAVADAASRSYRARYTLADDGAQAPLGATVTLAMQHEASLAVLQVPIGALFDRGRGPGVWRLDHASQQVSWQAVTVRQVGESRVSIAPGEAIQPGDTVVALGAHLLHDDQRVAPIAEAMGTSQQ